MPATNTSPLEILDVKSLYALLGDAWFEQFVPKPGEVYYLGSSEEMGRREFEMVRVHIRAELTCYPNFEVLPCVTRAINRAHAWRMPATVVAALSIREGLTSFETVRAA